MLLLNYHKSLRITCPEVTFLIKLYIFHISAGMWKLSAIVIVCQVDLDNWKNSHRKYKNCSLLVLLHKVK